MSMIERVMQNFYRKAEGRPEKLPWHQEEPAEILRKTVRARGGRGRALDVGCGAGVFSVWMAEQGLDVTGIDLFPEATAMARKRAEEHGVKIELITGDLFEYAPAQPFDLVFDSGCLHSLVGGNVPKYKQQVLRWLGRDADYVLLHWGKRHAFDWRPIGPRRRSEETIAKIFAPELTMRDKEITDFETPLPFGPVVRGIGYLLRRNTSSTHAS
jgi:cyclopropane fatty-acyl-phospholipid synthase-like methyltransferase